MNDATYTNKDSLLESWYDLLMESFDLNRFLLCSPYSSDPILNYGGIISRTKPEIFSKLYVEGKKRVEKNIINDIYTGRKSTIKIVGNKGCGKSTLIHHLSSVIKNSGGRSLVLDFGDQHATLEFNAAKDSIIQKIYERLILDFKENKCGTIKWMTDLYFEIDTFIERKWDANHKIEETFKLLYDLINVANIDRKKQLNLVRDTLFEMELYQLILVFLLSDIYENIDNKKTTIFLDNLDNMVYHGDVRKLLEHYYNFLNGMGSLYNEIRKYLKNEYDYKYVFVFVLRDSTDAYLSGHEYAIKQITDQEYDVSKY